MTASKNIAIIFASKYGFTKRVTLLLEERLSIPVRVFNIEEDKPDLSNFDTIVFGSPIHGGKFLRPLDKYIIENTAVLKNKRIGAYLTCIDEARIEEYFKTALSTELYMRVFYKACFGGALYFDKLHPVEKEVIKQITGFTKDGERLHEEKINLFVSHIESIIKA